MRLITSIFTKVAEKMGATVFIEPEYQLIGHIKFKNGKVTIFDHNKLDINGAGAASLAKDKGFSNYFLKQLGYHVSIGNTFFNDQICANISNPRNIHDGWNYAQKLGLPVIVKPLNLSQGCLVSKIYEESEYYHLAEKILAIQPGFIVERFYSGNDFRILVLEQEIIAAYQRIPLSVMGDGKSTIIELLNKKQENFLKNTKKATINFQDFRILQNLTRQNLSFDSIPDQDVIVYLLDNANLSTGGEAIDLTDKIHPDFQELAINITKDMGLRLAGVDILTTDITQPLLDYTLLEINSSPGLTYYASLGETQIQKVEYLYTKILQTLEKS
ncbi:MAG: cyanophycin synthetase [Nostocales cyanobacterium]|nr:MAG: cyanophycin synthetase [Nostocales cyanobacterium]